MSEVMTKDPVTVRKETRLHEIAEKMRDMNIGIIPVCEENGQVIGVITDRDIVMRAVAEAREIKGVMAFEVMSSNVITCPEDADVDDCVKLMEQHQIRRIPVLDSQRKLIGMFTLGDLAVDVGNERLAAEAIKKISEPAEPRRMAA